MTFWNTLLLVLFVLVVSLTGTDAYIPATPTNDTNAAIQAGLNVTDVSKLHLQWYSNGSYWENVSYQLVGANSNGFTQGAIVHFSEVNITNATTTTPWIALVSCDFNATNDSQEYDIFTLARDRGAVSALLYSVYSQACIINPYYADPASFDQVMDIFSTQSLTSATLIDYQFGQFGSQNETLYGSFNAELLNNSASVINATIQTNNPVAPGYLFATLRAYNATVGNNNTDNGNGTTANINSTGGGGSGNTGLAMIILYAITGCVSALFCVVIISGAIRAIRHPERYGPRTANQQDGGFGGPGQSRARGLTRAILDTFPVVKFGQVAEENGAPGGQLKDVEAPQEHPSTSDTKPRAMEMREWEVVDAADGNLADGGAEAPPSQPTPDEAASSAQQDGPRDAQPVASGSNTGPSVISAAPPAQPSAGQQGVNPRPPKSSTSPELNPDAIGNATCPICIVDFEEGDDLRVLPCEGKHKFHQQCVDPWLLELSSSCPICREDFHVLETMMSGDMDDGFNYYPPSGNRDSAISGNRFSRYLRTAIRRRNREHEGYDITDPYMPRAPES